jgi:hypothetical protein
MAQSSRIDSVSFPASGGVQVNFTSGATPLPSPSGSGEFYQTKEDLMAAIGAAEVAIAPYLHLIALSQWTKADPNMLSPSNATGKKATIDLSGGAQAISLG